MGRGLGWICGEFHGVAGVGFDGRVDRALRRVVASNRVAVGIMLNNMPDVVAGALIVERICVDDC